MPVEPANFNRIFKYCTQEHWSHNLDVSPFKYVPRISNPNKSCIKTPTYIKKLKNKQLYSSSRMNYWTLFKS